MKIFTFLIAAAAGFSSIIYAQTFQWVNIVPLNIQTNPLYLHSASAIDSHGNPVSARMINSREIYNIAYYGDTKIEKRDPSGELMWSDTIFGSIDVAKLIIDGQNNVICYGTFLDTLKIDTASLVHTGQETGIFLLKLDSTGTLAWLKDGAQYITGFGTITALAPEGLNNILLGTSDYPVEAQLIKLNSSGNQLSLINETNIATISDIKTDNSGNTWATGFAFNGPVSFNGHDTTAPFSYTEYVVKYSQSGVPLRINFIQDVTVQQYRMEIDDNRNVYLAGNLLDSTSFGNIHANGPQWVYDFFVTKMDPDGNFIWLNEIPPGNNLGDAYIGTDNFLSCERDGHTYLTGTFRGTVNFSDSITITPIDYSDLFVICYNPDGGVLWAKSAGGTSYDQGGGIIADGSGDYYLTGFVSDNFVFDTISGTGDIYNIYLAKLETETGVTAVNGSPEKTEVPDKFNLMQNYPNPFNPTTIIRYSVSEAGFVSLKVYDILGSETATLVNEYKPAGTYEINFSASGNGLNLSSGVYLYRLQEGKLVQSRKMVVVK